MSMEEGDFDLVMCYPPLLVRTYKCGCLFCRYITFGYNQNRISYCISCEENESLIKKIKKIQRCWRTKLIRNKFRKILENKSFLILMNKKNIYCNVIRHEIFSFLL
jgi:hypothetical protein